MIVDAADKVHLVPFGEYLPYESFLRRLGLQEVVEMPGGFTAGASRRALNVKDGQTFLPLICYEAIFPDELGYTGQRASAVINVTNDAWYGDTPGPYQHFRRAQVRAVEQGLPSFVQLTMVFQLSLMLMVRSPTDLHMTPSGSLTLTYRHLVHHFGARHMAHDNLW